MDCNWMQLVNGGWDVKTINLMLQQQKTIKNK